MLIQVAIWATLTASTSGQAPACSWVETVSRWSNGQRNVLKISVDQHYKGWNVTFTFDTPVTFEVHRKVSFYREIQGQLDYKDRSV